MRSAKHLALCGLACAVLSGCGVVAKPEAGTPGIRSNPAFRGKYVSARDTRVNCLTQDGYRVTLFASANRIPALRVEIGGNGPVLRFLPTAGGAEFLKLSGQAQGAELIGPVLLYPNDATLSEIYRIDRCAALGVS